jgi:hypothetical protein
VAGEQARTERLAANERAFREANTVTRSALERARARGPDDLLRFTCECSDPDCSEPVYLYEDEYLAVRRDDRRFFVACGHDIPRLEDVVEARDRYCVVQKQ